MENNESFGINLSQLKIYFFKALAFATVVVILLCFIKETAMLVNKAPLCEAVLPK